MGLLVSFKSKTEVIVKDLMTELKSVQLELIGSNDENEKLRAENPDHFFESAEDRDALLSAIFS